MGPYVSKSHRTNNNFYVLTQRFERSLFFSFLLSLLLLLHLRYVLNAFSHSCLYLFIFLNYFFLFPFTVSHFSFSFSFPPFSLMITKWSVSSSKRNPNPLLNCKTKPKRRRIMPRTGQQTLPALCLLQRVWRICTKRKNIVLEFSLFKNLEKPPMVLTGCRKLVKGVLEVFIKDRFCLQMDKVIQFKLPSKGLTRVDFRYFSSLFAHVIVFIILDFLTVRSSILLLSDLWLKGLLLKNLDPCEVDNTVFMCYGLFDLSWLIILSVLLYIPLLLSSCDGNFDPFEMDKLFAVQLCYVIVLSLVF